MASKIHAIPAAHGTPRWYQEAIARAKVDGVFAERVSLNPALAQEMLRDNPHNRGMSPAKKLQYTADIQNGRWAFNGECLLVSECGELNDGQHRCEAVIAANMPIDTMIIFGLSRESRFTLDQGIKRNAQHFLRMMEHPYYFEVASGGRLALAYGATRGRTIENKAISAVEVVKRFAFDEAMIESARWANANKTHARGMMEGSYLVFAHWVLSRHNRDAATLFMDSVFHGTGIEMGDALYTARSMLQMHDGLSRGERMHVLFRCWNAWRKGERFTQKMRDISSDLPDLQG